jgi:hypothetical protein
VCQCKRNNLAQRIGEGALVADDPGQRKAANEKDQHELKRSELFAGASAYNPHDQQQE